MKKKKIIAVLSALAVTGTLVLGNIKMIHANTLNSKAEARKIVS